MWAIYLELCCNKSKALICFQLLSLVTPLLQRLEWCNAGEVFAAIKVSDCLQFLPDEKAGVVGGHSIFGVVTTQAVSPFHCELETDGMYFYN